MAVLSGLKPEKVFYYFEKLCGVPHGSGNTKIISDLCVSFARELGLPYRQDAVNNVVIWKDATPGYENAEPILLQGHMDMVCTQTEDCGKDMAAEGLELVTDGEWVWADKTSLGGDNCIAVAMILAILAEDSLPHPPLEAVFTVDEETGMDGAVAIDCSDLKGRKMLNLDSEAEGIFTVSCAGGLRADCVLPCKDESLAGEIGYCVTVSGLLGGHSGAEIHRGRASANQLMGRVLYSALEKLGGIRIQDIRGGHFDNVICNLCEARLALPPAKAEAFEAFIRDFGAALQNEYRVCDPGLCLDCRRIELTRARSEKDSAVLLHTLLAMPQGVQEMSHDFVGLVQTSLNMGVIAMQEDGLHFSFSIRSCIASQKEMLLQRVRAIVGFAGGSVSTHGNYPGWQFKRDSAFRDLILEIWKEQQGKEGILEATHGGLECGLFIEKMPGLDVVSMGPELHDIHSCSEKLSVASTERLYALVREILKRSK